LRELEIKTPKSSVLSLKERLLKWDLLRKAWETYSLDPHHWLLSYQVYQSPKVEESIKAALQNTIALEFLPQLLNRLEGLLKRDQYDFEFKETLFRGYLVLHYPERLPKNWLIDAALQSWNENTALTSDEIASLRKHLEFILQTGFEPLNLDETIVKTLKEEWFKEPLAFWVYKSLNEKIKIDPKSTDVLAFLHKSGIMNEEVNNLSGYYTPAGILSLYLPEVSLLSRALHEENEWVASVLEEPLKQISEEEVLSAVNGYYAKDYLAMWQAVLFQLQLKPYTNLEEAVKGFKELSSLDSPLKHLFKLVQENVQEALTLDKSVSLEAPLKEFHDFLSADNTGANINPERFFKVLEEMSKCLNTLKEEKNIFLASYEATTNTLKPNSVTAINELMRISKEVPEPLRGWLETIGKSTWEILLKNSNVYLNDCWQKEVMVFYQKIKGYFPLTTEAEVEISLKSFGEFFGKKGVVSRFIHTYLEPYLERKSNEWHWKGLYGHSMSDVPMAAKQLQQVSDIAEQLYGISDNSLSLRFLLTPRHLTSDTSSVLLKIGKEKLTYRHGPLSAMKFSWEPNTQKERVTINFSEFNGENVGQGFDGDWNLLRLLVAGNIERGEDSESYRLKLKLEENEVEFLLKVEDKEAFEALLTGIEVPDYF